MKRQREPKQIQIISAGMNAPYLRQASAGLIEAQSALGEPLCITALWKRPWLPRESRW